MIQYKYMIWWIFFYLRAPPYHSHNHTYTHCQQFQQNAYDFANVCYIISFRLNHIHSFTHFWTILSKHLLERNIYKYIQHSINVNKLHSSHMMMMQLKANEFCAWSHIFFSLLVNKNHTQTHSSEILKCAKWK